MCVHCAAETGRWGHGEDEENFKSNDRVTVTTAWPDTVRSITSYLDSGSHSSWVSNVDRSVSVEVAEWAWWVGVVGRLVFRNFFQVERLSAVLC